MNAIETWKSEKHGLDVWPDLLRYAENATPMKQVDKNDLERMKWHGVLYRKRDAPGNYMLRVRITAGEMTAKQAKEVAYIAYEYGHGIVDVTTRANVQIQGLAIENVPKALSRLEKVGLTAKQTGHDNIRTVFCNPMSGIDPTEIIDTRALCHEISDLILDSRVYSDLPRKFNIALSGSEEHGVHYWSQDLSFLAQRTADGEATFSVLIAGTQGQNPRLAQHLPVLVMPDQVAGVTQVLLDLFRAKGNRKQRSRGRFRFLVEEIGIGGVLAWLEEHFDEPLVPSTVAPTPPTGYENLIGWLPQQSPKHSAMGLCLSLGRVSWQQLEGLALLSKRWGDGTLRLTPEQGLIIPNIRTPFKGAAATSAAAMGLSVHADTLARNSVACTGKQFCNIAVTETKGQMLQLLDKLRDRDLALEGIRIHMSGCPSACAQHFTADIGLKGVRVRRLIGTREGFDVYLGGGIAGSVHLAKPYRLGVDTDQLPQLIEEVVGEYYSRHQGGQTFSAYWREKLHAEEADKVTDGQYTPPTWLCEGCDHRFLGEDPPVFCPSCAGLRRLFARLEDGTELDTTESEAVAAAEKRADGFVVAGKLESLDDSSGKMVEIAGHEYALFRSGNEVMAIDDACPHEGASLGEGEFDGKAVACPWHAWKFDACSGCSIDPKGHNVTSYETKIEEGHILLKPAAASAEVPKSKPTSKASTGELTVSQVICETPDTKTFYLDNSARQIPIHFPGQFVRLGATINGEQVWRSFTISSSPTQANRLDITIKRNESGVLSKHLLDTISGGNKLSVRGPYGNFYLDALAHTEPLVLVAAGSGVTPMMSMMRLLADNHPNHHCTLVYGARKEEDIINDKEFQALIKKHANFAYHVYLSQPHDQWQGGQGRVTGSHVFEHVHDPTASRYFLCGPGQFIDQLTSSLVAGGAKADMVHSEEFSSPTAEIVAV